MRQSLEKINNIPLKEDQWTQSSLPVARSGIGIRRATDIALPAFLASAHGASVAASRLLHSDIAEEEYQDLRMEIDIFTKLLHNRYIL